MTKTKTLAELVTERDAGIQAASQRALELTTQIEALQIDPMKAVLAALDKPLAEALPELLKAAEDLTDNRQATVRQLVAQAQYVIDYLPQEIERIGA